MFAGTPKVAKTALLALTESKHEVVGVVTRPAARKGRGQKLQLSPVRQLADELNLPVIETNSPADPNILIQLVQLQPDLGVVVAYGAILPKRILEIPRFGWINLHFSDLPRWRGASPVQHTIMNRDPRACTSVFQLETGLDTGPIYDSRCLDLTGSETSGQLLGTLGELGAKQLVDVVDQIQAGTIRATPQDEGTIDSTKVTYAPRLSKTDAFVDFTKSALEIDALIRAVTPEPGAWTTVLGKTLRLGPVKLIDTSKVPIQLDAGVILAQKKRLLVGCQDGLVELGEVMPEGRKWMEARAWFNGARLDDDVRLGGLDQNVATQEHQ